MHAVPDPYCILADSGFRYGAALATKVLTPYTRRSRLSADPELRQVQLRFHAALVRCRQAAEWGMRSIQSTFSRLKLPLSSVHSTRHQLLSIVFLLHNFMCRAVRINQTLFVYSPEWDARGDRVMMYYRAAV
jgi:hypothetical protein